MPDPNSDTTQPQLVENDSPNLIPPAGKPKDVGKKVYQILDAILKDKDNLGLPQKWAYHYELGKNKHWKTDSKKASLISANFLNTHRQRSTNMLTDNNPTFEVVQIGDVPDDEILEIYMHTAEFYWRNQDQQAAFEISVNQGETNGCTIIKSVFNPDLELGLGEAETINVPPWHFGLYPVKTMEVQKAEAALHFYPMTLRKARAKWPDKAKQIQSDSEYLSQVDDAQLREIQSGKPGRMQSWFASIGGAIKHMVGNVEGQTSGIGGEEDELLVVECWVKDKTATKENGEQFPKYPGEIRYIVCCNGGEVVMEDRGNPSINPKLELEEAAKTYLWDKFPFDRKHSNTDTVNPWGMGDFEQLKALNLEINKTLSQFGLFKDKASRLKFINPRNSGVSNESLDNYPGTIRPRDHIIAAAMRYVDPPRNPTDLIAAFNLYKEIFFMVAGTFELELAQSPGREVIAYKAIAALLERATTMLRGKVRNYSGLITEQGRMYFSHVQNWYTEDRYIDYEKDGEKQVKKINGQMLRIPAKLTVVPGSTMPVSQIQRREEALSLWKERAITHESFLKYINWPDWKNEAKRVKLGPFGGFLQLLEQLGAPPVLLEYFQQLFSSDQKEIQKAVEKGEFPAFPQVLQALLQQGEGQPPPDPAQDMEIRLKEAEVDLKLAEAEKVRTETELIDEKVVTERILQYVKSSGVELDEIKLGMERAKVIEEIANERMAGTDVYRKKRGQGPFRDRGLRSDNERIQ